MKYCYEDYYHAIVAFRADFEMIQNGRETFSNLQRLYKRDSCHIKREQDILIEFLFLSESTLMTY